MNIESIRTSEKLLDWLSHKEFAYIYIIKIIANLIVSESNKKQEKSRNYFM